MRFFASLRMTSIAPQQIVVNRFFDFPHRRAAMIRETIECAEFRQGSQFLFGKRNAPFEIVQRIELSATGRTRRGESLSNELFGMLLSKPVHHTKSEAKSIVIDHGAAEIGFGHADRLDLHSVPLRVFHNGSRRIKAHRLIVEQTGVKLRRAMHFQIRARISQNGKTDRMRFRKSVSANDVIEWMILSILSGGTFFRSIAARSFTLTRSIRSSER